MTRSSEEEAEALSLGRVYEEYVRLSEVCNDYIHRSLGDIRLFGSIGALLAWDPGCACSSWMPVSSSR